MSYWWGLLTLVEKMSDVDLLFEKVQAALLHPWSGTDTLNPGLEALHAIRTELNQLRIERDEALGVADTYFQSEGLSSTPPELL